MVGVIWKSFYPNLRFIPGTPGSSFYNHPDRNTKRAATTATATATATTNTTIITPSSGSNVKTASSAPGNDRLKLAATTIFQKNQNFVLIQPNLS